MPAALPNFIIIGAQKAASSFLHEGLQSHPQVFMPVDEVPYFEDPYFVRQPLTEFSALFAGAGKQHRAIGIRRPDYLAHPECPARIRQVVPDAKLIAVLRDPVARAVSAYFWYMRLSLIPLQPLDLGMAQILTGGQAALLPNGADILEFGFYGKHLRRYLEHFPREQLMLLLYEEVSKQPVTALQTLFRFINVEETFQPRTMQRRPKQAIYSLARLRFLRIRNPYIHHSNYYHYGAYDRARLTLTGRKGLLPYALRVGLAALDRLLLAPVLNNEKPQLAPALEAELRARYRDDILQLSDLLECDLSRWLQPERKNSANLPV
jgi:hypothetical protein